MCITVGFSSACSCMTWPQIATVLFPLWIIPWCEVISCFRCFWINSSTGWTATWLATLIYALDRTIVKKCENGLFLIKPSFPWSGSGWLHAFITLVFQKSDMKGLASANHINKVAFIRTRHVSLANSDLALFLEATLWACSFIIFTFLFYVSTSLAFVEVI